MDVNMYFMLYICIYMYTPIMYYMFQFFIFHFSLKYSKNIIAKKKYST